MDGSLDSSQTRQGVTPLNRLAIGTVQFGIPYGIANRVGQVARSESSAILKFASTSGIDTLDTAIAYGDSEECLGEIGTQGFKVITKLPLVPDSCVDINTWVTQQVQESLKRLGLAKIYGLLLHRPDQLLGPNGATLFRSLIDLKTNGFVQNIGVSIYSPLELEALTPSYRFDLVQAPFNLIDQRLHISGWLHRLNDLGIEVHTRSTFLQGLLLMAKADIPKNFSTWNNLWEIWHRWLDVHGISAVQASLAFPLSFPEIDRVVIGVQSLSQLSQIVSEANASANYNLPNLQCDDSKLINPANWIKL